jgi:hypothetical protein
MKCLCHLRSWCIYLILLIVITDVGNEGEQVWGSLMRQSAHTKFSHVLLKLKHMDKQDMNTANAFISCTLCQEC